MPQPTVHILLATYNGGRFLAEQLNSIARQTHTDWTLTVSDDGSTDNTLDIVAQFAEQVGQPVTLLQGPRMGSTYNFFCLIQKIPVDHPQDFFAFCDQDDVWLPEKLANAIEFLTRGDNTKAANLYCGRTTVTNESLKPIGMSEIPQRALTFGNALAQNMASGNTMVFTARLLEILKHIKPEHSVWHDWSAYQVAFACGGVVHFDGRAYVLYRQHSSNVVGKKNSLVSRLERISVNLRGRYRGRGDLTENAIQDISPFMTEDSKKIFNAYREARHARTGLGRLRYAKAAGIYRQGRLEQLAFIVALFMGKV